MKMTQEWVAKKLDREYTPDEIRAMTMVEYQNLTGRQGLAEAIKKAVAEAQAERAGGIAPE